jgi:hypothetical protein
MAFIDDMGSAARTVESTYAVLSGGGCRVAARTYRALDELPGTGRRRGQPCRFGSAPPRPMRTSGGRPLSARALVHDEQSLDVDQGVTAVVCSQIMKRNGPTISARALHPRGTLSGRR